MYWSNPAFQTAISIWLTSSCVQSSEDSRIAECHINSDVRCGATDIENLVRTRSGRQRKPPVTKFLDDVFSERLFNTTMNFIVPGAKIHLARHTDEGPADHLALQAFFGLFWASAWIATIAVPAAVLYFKPLGLGRSLTSEENDFHLKWKLNHQMVDTIGLDWRTCLQKTVCESHKLSGARGDIGSLIEVLFPAEDNVNSNGYQDKTNWLIEAAHQGAIGQNCELMYKCFFDILDIINYIKNGYLY